MNVITQSFKDLAWIPLKKTNTKISAVAENVEMTFPFEIEYKLNGSEFVK